MKKPSKIKIYAENQYQSHSLLQSRINIWKYGLNKVPITKWIFSQINFPDRGKVLELGSGTGKLWLDNLKDLPNVDSIILSDFSEGMLSRLKQNLNNTSDLFSFQQINAQSIPFPDLTFDCVIACHMLYHVLDLDAAINEVYRTLKPDGKFYATTVYEDHLKDLYNIVNDFDLKLDLFASNHSDFWMSSGFSWLKTKFDNVQIKNYLNRVIITDDNLDALMVYLRSSFTPEFYPNYSSVEHKIKQVISDLIDDQGEFVFTGKSGMLIATK